MQYDYSRQYLQYPSMCHLVYQQSCHLAITLRSTIMSNIDVIETIATTATIWEGSLNFISTLHIIAMNVGPTHSNSSIIFKLTL